MTFSLVISDNTSRNCARKKIWNQSHQLAQTCSCKWLKPSHEGHSLRADEMERIASFRGKDGYRYEED